MIFGSNGKNYARMGDVTTGPGGVFSRIGDTTFGPNGKTICQMGDVSMFSQGNRRGHAVRMGDTWSSSRGTYTLMGSTLCGPNGRTWYNVRPEDVPMLIADDN